MRKKIGITISSIATVLSGIWWWKEGGYEPVIVFLGGVGGIFLSTASKKSSEPTSSTSVYMHVEADVLDGVYSRVLRVEGSINKSFLDRRLWNEIQDNLDDLLRYYHENKTDFPKSFDEKVLEAIKVGRCVMSCKINQSIPDELAKAYISSKDSIVEEIRELKAVAPQI
ncbi:hypothetical protein FNO25_003982 [Vibrio fluvialis]|nr:hypothetical protein [Vibrio parahaemolyticus]EJP4175548.1 hypothetical protein [Vibrio vulnificus]EKA6048970.1 hypothetical protein [Vibrio vulnificus]EKO3975958.1 hypothetical protein [Vibrio fluvialis]